MDLDFLLLNSRSRILITGVTSIHGWPIYKKLKAILPPGRLFGIRPPQMTVPDDDNVTSVCMTDADALSAINDSFRPTHVLHAAGVCDLDICEDRPRYAHDPDPVSVVGRTYVLAEKEIRRAPRWCLVRVGLPMGESIRGEKGAVDFIKGRLKRGLPMSLFHDEWRSCIDCDELADVVLELLHKEAQGLFHLGGPHAISLYEIGRRILEKGNYKKEALKKWSRHDDVDGPPRIGNVHLNSARVEALMGRKIREWTL